MSSIQDEIAGLLPLRVDGFSENVSFINLFSGNWNVSVDCSWKLRRRDGTAVATSESSSESINAAVGALVGHSVVKVQIDEDIYDPVFVFDDGTELAIEAETDLDPWVFHADGLAVVLVGIGPGGYADRKRTGES